MNTYTLHITRQQALTLQVACEVLGRLGLGQFRDALEHLPTSEWRPEGWNEDMDAIGAILSKYVIQGVDGWRHSLVISSDKTGDTAKDAWDLYTVIRHRLSWDAAIERGDIKPGEPRKWPEMMGVSYDEPMRHGKEPLARISADAAAAQGDAEDATYRERWDAELGRTAMKFVDRAGDVHPGVDDAEAICAEFHAAMSAVIERMPHVQRMNAANEDARAAARAAKEGAQQSAPTTQAAPAAVAGPSDEALRLSVDHAHEILRRLMYHRDGDFFINVNRRGAEAIHVSTIATIVHAALVAAPTTQAAPQPAAQQGDALDAARLDWLRDNSCDLRCVDSATGQGDGDIHWIVIEHHMAAPVEREIGRAYRDDPRAAIDAARAARSQTKEGA